MFCYLFYFAYAEIALHPYNNWLLSNDIFYLVLDNILRYCVVYVRNVFTLMLS